MVQERDDIVALDSAVILNPRVWEASGHVAGFPDPPIACPPSTLPFRAPHTEPGPPPPSPRPGPPQGIYLNSKTAAQPARGKPPFGIAQVGKSFRNEITP